MEIGYKIMAVAVELLAACCLTFAEDTREGHWGAWGALSPCSVTCGLGTTNMERVWIPGPKDPLMDEPFTSTQVFPCTHETYPECPRKFSEDGVWSGWMGWSRCTKVCGGGLRERQRECYGQLYGGEPCEGETFDKEECSRQPCPPLPKNFDLSQCKDSSNFTCVSQKMCVPVSQKCDTVVQCHDGSDEEDCFNINFMREGNVRYGLSMWRNSAVSRFSSAVVYVAAQFTFIILSLLH